MLCAYVIPCLPWDDCVLFKTVNFVHTGQTRRIQRGQAKEEGSGGGSKSGGPANQKTDAGTDEGGPEIVSEEHADSQPKHRHHHKHYKRWV